MITVKTVASIAGVIALISLIVTITVIALCVKGCSHVSKYGLKNVAESIWEGSDAKTNAPAKQ